MSVELKYGDLLVWKNGTVLVRDGDESPVMFLRWSRHGDNYHRPGAWLGIKLRNPDYPFDAGYPTPEPSGTLNYHWEKVE